MVGVFILKGLNYMKKPRYQFYATLLDKFEGYLSSSQIYQDFWGFSDDPEFSEEEFGEKQRQSLLDAINRVPFDSEAADRGTAFNEVVDFLIMNQKSPRMEMKSDKENGIITVGFRERIFTFPTALCLEFSNYYKGGIPQVFTEAILPTNFGDVLLYGYIDELMPLAVCDIKTSSKYSAGKFKRNWQHIVYPYCLNQNGNMVSDFEYNVAVIGAKSYSTFTEHYAYVPERDNKKLTEHVEMLIDFIELNKHLITDKKIFNQH